MRADDMRPDAAAARASAAAGRPVDVAAWAERARALCGEAELREIAEVVLAEPTPSGAERTLAERLASWGRAREGRPAGSTSRQRWEVEPLGAGRANLMAWTSRRPWRQTRGVWFYTHLDHSLSGDPALDHGLTGWTRPPADPLTGGETLRGLGLAVSKGPAIAALAAYRALAAAAAQLGIDVELGVILAAGGTHRAPPPGPSAPLPPGLDTGLGLGVQAALAQGWRPDAVINVKGGASGVLSAEPGCLLLQIDWREPFTALPARGAVPGAAVVAGRIAVAVEEWRPAYRAWADDGQVAGDLVVGSVRSGLPYKTDLLPGHAAVGVYLSTTAAVTPDEVAARLAEHIRAALARDGVDTGRGTLTVTPYAHHPAAATDEGEPIVRAGRAAWERRFGAGSSVVRGYRGSTDGVIFRRCGVPVVRFGPTPRPSAADPTVEEISMADVHAFAGLYIDTVTGYVRARGTAGGTDGGTAGGAAEGAGR